MQTQDVHSIQLTTGQLQIVFGALQELPYRLSAPVLAAIQTQLNEAEKHVEPAPALGPELAEGVAGAA